MTEQSDQTITMTSEDQDARIKAEMKSADAVPTKKWRAFHRGDPEDAANFANLEPPQQAGEAIFSVRDDSTVDLFLFY